MTEAEFIALIKNMNDAEKRELLAFFHFLRKRQDEGIPVTHQEAYNMGVAARDRIASQQ